MMDDLEYKISQTHWLMSGLGYWQAFSGVSFSLFSFNELVLFCLNFKTFFFIIDLYCCRCG